MGKRNFIEEIKARRSRTEFNNRYDLNSRLSKIELGFREFLDYNGEYTDEIIRYLPISTIACIEAFIRSVIKELIDFGEPFSKNVAKFNQSKNVKIDFELISAIQSKTLTIGEFVSHLLPCNNFVDINFNLSTLIGDKFIERLKGYDKMPIVINSEFYTNFAKDFPDILESINRTFELRHIFCHEFADNLEIHRDQIIKDHNNCKLFLKQVDHVIWEILYPNSPETVADMVKEVISKYAKANEELESLILFIKTNISANDEYSEFDENAFDECIRNWRLYQKSYAMHRSVSYKGSTMHPIYWNNALIVKAYEQIESLKEDYAFLLRKYKYS